MTRFTTKQHIFLAVITTCMMFSWSGVSLAQDNKDGSLPPKTLEVKPGAELNTSKPIKRRIKRIKLGSKNYVKGKKISVSSLAQASIKSTKNASKIVRKNHGININAFKYVFDGDFNSFHKRNRLSQLVTFQEHSLIYYSGSHRVSRRQNINLVSAKTLKKLGGSKQSLIPVQIIQDGTTQVLAWRSVKNQRGDTLYKITLYKVFGRYFGKAFDHTIGVKFAGKSKIHRTANFDFIQGKKHIDLHITSLDRKGTLLTNTIQIHTYHVWEGQFRVPTKVPTSPRKKRSARK